MRKARGDLLLPIVCAVFTSGELMIISVSGCLAGFVQNAWIVLPVSLAVLLAVLFTIRAVQSKKA